MKQINVVIIGDSSVGKTSIIKSVTQKAFGEDFSYTIGVDYSRIKDDDIEIQIWDTSGMEKFKTLTTSYYRSADVIIIVYDVSEPDSYENVMTEWIPQVSRFKHDIHIVLAGNKTDLSKQEFPDLQNTKHFRVSAKEYTCSCIFEYIKSLYVKKPEKKGLIYIPKYIGKKIWGLFY